MPAPKAIYKNEAAREAMIHAVTLGLSLNNAAQYAGLDLSQAVEWMAADKPFRGAIDRARGTAKMLVVQSLMEQINGGNYNAMVFWLSSRCPEFRGVHTSKKWDSEIEDAVTRVVFVDTDQVVPGAGGAVAIGNEATAEELGGNVPEVSATTEEEPIEAAEG